MNESTYQISCVKFLDRIWKSQGKVAYRTGLSVAGSMAILLIGIGFKGQSIFIIIDDLTALADWTTETTVGVFMSVIILSFDLSDRLISKILVTVMTSFNATGNMTNSSIGTISDPSCYVNVMAGIAVGLIKTIAMKFETICGESTPVDSDDLEAEIACRWAAGRKMSDS